MNSSPGIAGRSRVEIPPDDLSRQLALAQAHKAGFRHIGVVGDTYTILLSVATRTGDSALSTCTYRREEDRLRTATTSKRRLSYWKASWRLRSGGRSQWFGQARRSTFCRTRRTSSTTARSGPCACCACARRPARRSSFRRSAFPWRAARLRRRSWISRHKRSSLQRPRSLRPSSVRRY